MNSFIIRKLLTAFFLLLYLSGANVRKEMYLTLILKKRFGIILTTNDDLQINKIRLSGKLVLFR